MTPSAKKLQLQREIAIRLLTGERPGAIRRALHLTPRRYRKLAAEVLTEWQAAILPTEHARALELARVDWLARTAHALHLRATDADRADFNALKLIEWCIDRRIKLLALDDIPPALSASATPLTFALHWGDEHHVYADPPIDP